MTREKKKQKTLMYLFYALFYIFLIFHCALPIIAIINYWTSVDRFSEFFFGFAYFFFAFLGIMFSFIFFFLAKWHEEHYLGPENNPMVIHKAQKGKWIVFGCGVTLALAGLGTYTGIKTHDYLEIVTFNRERWIYGEPNERGQMVDSFVRDYHLLSLDQEQVDYYLGTPDYDGESYYRYFVGDYGHSFAIDPFSFTIHFGMDDHVTRWTCYES